MEEEHAMSDSQRDDSVHWLDAPGNVRKVYRWVWIASVVLLLGGEAILAWARAHPGDHAGHIAFYFETWPGFYALFGFAACVSLVLAAKQLRKLVMRPEDYYEPEDPPRREGDDGH
jgi:hypothetical protein